MVKKYKYRLGRRSRWITGIIFLLIAAATISFYLWLPNQYIPTWFVVTILCLLSLIVLSIPRYIKLDDDALEIHCIVDLTRIHVEDIESVRLLQREEAKRIIPLLASYGFFGYFGYFFSLRGWNFFKVYTTSLDNRIVIEDIHEGYYIVNCDDPEEFIQTVLAVRDMKRAEIFREITGVSE